MTDQPSVPVDRRTASHYTWGDACDGWHLVRTPALSVIEERMPPRTSEARHYHRAAAQFFYVLRGRLSIEVAGRHHDADEAGALAISDHGHRGIEAVAHAPRLDVRSIATGLSRWSGRGRGLPGRRSGGMR